jgi:hypothetical protein
MKEFPQEELLYSTYHEWQAAPVTGTPPLALFYTQIIHLPFFSIYFSFPLFSGAFGTLKCAY